MKSFEEVRNLKIVWRIQSFVDARAKFFANNDVIDFNAAHYSIS